MFSEPCTSALPCKVVDAFSKNPGVSLWRAFCDVASDSRQRCQSFRHPMTCGSPVVSRVDARFGSPRPKTDRRQSIVSSDG